jgi:hypothetical protein
MARNPGWRNRANPMVLIRLGLGFGVVGAGMTAMAVSVLAHVARGDSGLIVGVIAGALLCFFISGYVLGIQVP